MNWPKEWEPNFGAISLVWCPLQSQTLLCFIQLTASQKSSLKVWNSFVHSNPSKISNITLCSILPPVTEPSTASLLKGIHFRWANLAVGWISFIRAQHKGIRCNVPASSFLEDLCVFFQAVLRHELVPATWVPVKLFKLYKIGSLLPAFRYPAKAFLRQSQKRAFTGETGFSACYYTPR